MTKKTIYIFAFWLSLLAIGNLANGQDTFSIVAVDSATGEVGAAGATCIKMDTLSGLINRLVPGKGAINAQASSSVKNLLRGRNYLIQNIAPENIIDSLKKYDENGTPQARQNLIASFDSSGRPQVASFTGNSAMSYAGSINGTSFAVSGNILSGADILDSMYLGFNSLKNSALSDKLMMALLKANVVGADKRCSVYGTSSLSAFIKVAKPNDKIGSPSLKIENGVGALYVDPIDQLLKDYLKVNISRVEYPKVICIGDTFTSKISNELGPVNWTWNGKTTQDSQIVLTGLTVGKYVLSCSYFFGNENVTEQVKFEVSSGGEVSLGSDTSVCAKSFLLILPKTKNVKTISWKDGWNGIQRVIEINKDTVLVATATDKYGCIGISDTVKILCNNLPKLYDFQLDTFCLNDSFKIDLDAIGTMPFAFFLENKKVEDAQFSGVAKQDFFQEIKIIDGNSCSSVDSIWIMVDSTKLNLTVRDTSICYSDSISISGSTSYKNGFSNVFFWGEDKQVDSSIRVSDGQYSFCGISPRGCIDSIDVNIQAIIPQGLGLKFDSSVCEGSDVLIKSQLEMEWSDGFRGLERTFFQLDSMVNLQVRNVNDTNCRGLWEDVMINVSQVPNANFIANVDPIPNEEGRYMAEFINTSKNPSHLYEWDFGDGNDTTGIDPIHEYAKEGVYPVSLIVSDDDCPDDNFKDTLSVGSIGGLASQHPTVFKISPNPSSGFFNLSVSNNLANTAGRYIIYNLVGTKMLVVNKEVSSSNFIDLSQFENGLYIIRLEVGGSIYSRTLFKNSE